MLKKLFGILLILLSLLLLLAIVGRLPSLIRALIEFFLIFTGKLDAYEISRGISQLLVWVLHFALMIWFWKSGRRWVRE